MLKGRKRKTHKCFYALFYFEQNCGRIRLFSGLSGLSLDAQNRSSFFLLNLSNYPKKKITKFFLGNIFTCMVLCNKISIYDGFRLAQETAKWFMYRKINKTNKSPIFLGRREFIFAIIVSLTQQKPHGNYWFEILKRGYTAKSVDVST